MDSIFSFFSGAGFLDLGFEKTNGFDVVFCNEIVPQFAEAYTHSRVQMGLKLPKYGIEIDSIDELNREPHLSKLKSLMAEEKNEGRRIGIIGGPPCPDFSVAGKNLGRNGENGRLSKSYIDLICKLNPDWFLFENVKGLWKTKKHRAFYEELKKKLSVSGYLMFDDLLNSMQFGVPQDRERVILLGYKNEVFEQTVAKAINGSGFPWDKKIKYSREKIKAYDWPQTAVFGGFPDKPEVPEELTVDYWFKKNQTDTHPNSIHFFKPRSGLKRFLNVDEGDVSRKSFKRLHRYRYSPTVAYGNNEVHLHPYEPRRLSVAEALSLQSLPKEYRLPDTMSLTMMYKTIGNGVPYLFSKGIAETIRETLK